MRWVTRGDGQRRLVGLVVGAVGLLMVISVFPGWVWLAAVGGALTYLGWRLAVMD